MPFRPGELVDLNFTGEPDTTTLTFQGKTYTLANGGLQLKRKSALKAIFRLPKARGKYPYTWTDGERTETGHLRVRGTDSAKRLTPAPQHTEPPFAGVRARRL